MGAQQRTRKRKRRGRVKGKPLQRPEAWNSIRSAECLKGFSLSRGSGERWDSVKDETRKKRYIQGLKWEGLKWQAWLSASEHWGAPEEFKEWMEEFVFLILNNLAGVYKMTWNEEGWSLSEPSISVYVADFSPPTVPMLRGPRSPWPLLTLPWSNIHSPDSQIPMSKLSPSREEESNTSHQQQLGTEDSQTPCILIWLLTLHLYLSLTFLFHLMGKTGNQIS